MKHFCSSRDTRKISHYSFKLEWHENWDKWPEINRLSCASIIYASWKIELCVVENLSATKSNRAELESTFTVASYVNLSGARDIPMNHRTNSRAREGETNHREPTFLAEQPLSRDCRNAPRGTECIQLHPESIADTKEMCAAAFPARLLPAALP